MILAAFSTAFLVLVQATPGPMDSSALKAAYSDQTHLSFYRRYIKEYGGVYFEEYYHPDGTLDYRAGEVTLTGFWRVSDGRICFDYIETPLSSGCFVVVHESGCYYSYEIGTDGKPIGLETGEWWIRAHIKGTNPECAAEDLIANQGMLLHG